jgi:hypothetical protein
MKVICHENCSDARSADSCTFFEFYEEIDWEGGDDPQYSKYIPVDTGAEIEMLKKASPLQLLHYFPQLRHDFPKGAKSPTTYWAKNS